MDNSFCMQCTNCIEKHLYGTITWALHCKFTKVSLAIHSYFFEIVLYF